MKNRQSKLQNEIEHGKKISFNAEEVWGWSTPAGKLRSERRVDYFIEYGKINSQTKVLEIGCGTALFTEKIYKKVQPKLIATDLSKELLEQAKLKLPEVTFIEEDAMNLSFDNSTFDCVYGSSILHHLDFEDALKEIMRVLKPSGQMIFAEPNMLNPQIFLQKNIPYIKRKMGDTPDETAIVRWSFAKKMKKCGFVNIKLFPYDFLHPATPVNSINWVNKLGLFLEKTPLIREIAGSVIISGQKPLN